MITLAIDQESIVADVRKIHATHPRPQRVHVSAKFAGKQEVADVKHRDLPFTYNEQLAWFEDYAFLRGDGTGKPLGAAVCPAAIGVTRSTTNTFKLADAATMLGRLLPGWSLGWALPES